MAEILNSGVNHYFKDVATSGGNTIIGAAVPTDFATQGISKEAGESGVFVYTDKSFTIYFCYGGTWVQYMAVDATDSDFANSISIPWADHDTHGAVTGMYFVTAEADHEIRAVKISGDLITDFIPTDADLTKNALIVDETSVSNTGSVIEGAGTYFNYEHDLSGKSVGDTISYTLNGVVGGALTFMDTYTQVQTTILYNAETGQSAISFVLPADWNSSKAINTFSRGGSPLSDPFTRGVSAPTGNLALFINMNDNANILDSAGAAADDTDAIQTINATGETLVQTTAAKQPSYYVNGKNMYNGITGTQDSIYLPQPGLYSGEDGFDFTPFAWDNGFTFAYSFAQNSKRYTGGSYRTMIKANDANGTNTTFELVISENMEAANDKCKIRLRFKPDGQAYIYQYDSAEGVITPHQFDNIIAVWDGSAERPTVKVNGVEVEFGAYSTKTGSYNVSQFPQYSSYGPYGVFGDFAAYSSGLSGTDLEQLEAYYDFKYNDYSDEEVMFNEANWAGIMASTVVNPPGGTPTSITGYNSGQAYMEMRTEKMFLVGSRTEIKFSSTIHTYNGPSHIFVTDDLEWQSKNKKYGYYFNDMKSSSAGVLLRVASNYIYLYESDGAGNMPLRYSTADTQIASDEVSFIVEWDGTCKLAKNGTVLFTMANKFTVGNHYAPFLWQQRQGEASLSIDGNLVDFAWPSSYSSETPSDATPTFVSGSAVITDNHINYGANPQNKGGKVKIGTLQGEGAYVDYQVNPYHANTKYNMSLSTTADIFAHNDANAEIGIRVSSSTTGEVYTSGTIDHLMNRPSLGGYTTWADYYNDISNSYEGDGYINKYGFGRMRIQFYDGYVIIWSNGYPIYRIDGIDTSLQYEFNIDMWSPTWSPGLEDIKIYNP